MGKEKLLEEIKSLETELESSDDVAKKTELMAKLSVRTLHLSPDNAFSWADRGIELARKTKDTAGLMKCLTAKAIAYSHRGDYNEALDIYMGVLQVAKSENQSDYRAKTLNNIGIVYMRTGYYAKAVESFQEAYGINEKAGDKLLLSANLANIGDVHLAQNDFDQAAVYYRRSLGIRKELGDSLGIAHALCGLAGAYRGKNQSDKAIEMYKEALVYYNKEGIIGGKATILNNIGTIRKEQDDYESAYQVYLECLKIFENLNEKPGIASTHVNLASLDVKTGDYDRAIAHAEKGLELAQSMDLRRFMKSAYHVLSLAYEAKGETDKAFGYFKEFKLVSDVVLNLDKSRQIERIEAKFILEKKEREAEIYRRASITDSMTNLFNRKGIMEVINTIIAAKEKFSIIIGDIDFFKKFNDTFGHECGDFVLCKTADIMRESVGDDGHVARWGGEEFLILLPGESSDHALDIAEKIRARIESEEHRYGSANLSITMSFGISRFFDGMDIDECIRFADAALYSAKENGRNRVMMD